MTLSKHSHRLGQAKSIVIAMVAILAIIAAVWLILPRSTQPDATAGQKVAEAFLAAIREGDPGKAWDATTAEFKSAQGRESFVRSCQPRKFLREPLEYVSVQTVNVQEKPHSEFVFRSPSQKGAGVRIVIGQEAGTWKVDRWVVDAPK
jgi:hypothetical protein